MPTNKHAIIRYQALDACFSNRYRKFYMDDLIEACNKALEDFYLPKETEVDIFYVKRRTIFNDIAYMESSKGWSAPIERIYEGHKCYYRYSDPDFSINKKEFSDAELDLLDDALVMMGRFRGLEGFDWIEEFIANFQDKLGRKRNALPVIGYDRNPYLKGIEYLSRIYNYIINHQVIRVTYGHFKKGQMVHIVHPYYLKEYNKRWFLFGITEHKKDSLISLPLDRINSIEPEHIPYIPNETFNFEDYFGDVIGTSVPTQGEPEDIVLRFSPDRFPYVTTKPLHPSQKIIDKEKCIIQITVFINRELEALVSSYGEEVEVISPETLRCKFSEKVNIMSSIYK